MLKYINLKIKKFHQNIKNLNFITSKFHLSKNILAGTPSTFKDWKPLITIGSLFMPFSLFSNNIFYIASRSLGLLRIFTFIVRRDTCARARSRLQTAFSYGKAFILYILKSLCCAMKGPFQTRQTISAENFIDLIKLRARYSRGIRMSIFPKRAEEKGFRIRHVCPYWNQEFSY